MQAFNTTWSGEDEGKNNMDDIKDKALKAHEDWQGKIEVISRVTINNRDDLSVCYTPGVAEPCKLIAKDGELSYKYTRRGNLVAVITDGSAVLGLGNIGGLAGMPVMEGKCALFKRFADIDAFPLCIKSQNVDDIVNIIYNLGDSFGGINLEDISAPRCFEIERKLNEMLDIPVFHDDQHGTAIVVSAALINSLKVVGKDVNNAKVVIVGAGAAGTAIAELIKEFNPSDIVMCDIGGIIYRGDDSLSDAHRALAEWTNKENIKGSLADAVVNADVLIGVSKPKVINGDMIKSMANKPIVFAMSNPVPEIMPDEAKAYGAAVVGTGRSDYPNQINNVLAFPGIFRGALDARARKITPDMMKAAVYAIAELVGDELSSEYIIPSVLDERVVGAVATAVAKAYSK